MPLTGPHGRSICRTFFWPKNLITCGSKPHSNATCVHRPTKPCMHLDKFLLCCSVLLSDLQHLKFQLDVPSKTMIGLSSRSVHTQKCSCKYEQYREVLLCVRAHHFQSKSYRACPCSYRQSQAQSTPLCLWPCLKLRPCVWSDAAPDESLSLLGTAPWTSCCWHPHFCLKRPSPAGHHR